MEKDIASLQHTTWRCQYHVVFAPKYRRMAIYGKRYMWGSPADKKTVHWTVFCALRCAVLFDPSTPEIKNSSPAGIRLGSYFLCRWWGSNPHGVTTNGF